MLRSLVGSEMCIRDRTCVECLALIVKLIKKANSIRATDELRDLAMTLVVFERKLYTFIDEVLLRGADGRSLLKAIDDDTLQDAVARALDVSCEIHKPLLWGGVGSLLSLSLIHI
eukprot:TRINITY_DN55989_c0_g1_i2.p2 TRINITY_DN55989_c0_g1~~TRINITY_DN55989_c0_g1_i2.p2  ORF type:complete len:115 (+),score=42.14 TRINITY_DN55989_c0_g1_i2:96-440(+)